MVTIWLRPVGDRVAERLRAASPVNRFLQPAAAFGPADRERSALGLRADLLLVAGDPTINVTTTRAITAVWHGGSRIDREAYRSHAIT